MKKYILIPVLAVLFLAGKGPASAQNLSSLPGSAYVLYLDFDGHADNSGWWSSTAFPDPVTTAPSTLNSTQITEVFNRVSEDFRPFNINVTTDATVYGNALQSNKQRIVITPTSQFYTDANGSAGGVAFLNVFGGGEIAGYVFSNFLGNSPKNIAEAASHEAGHTLGLQHHSKFNSSCQYETEYHPGLGTGQTKWAPIMGNSYSSIISQWYHGAANDPTCTQGIQDDLAVITTQNGFGYRNDDFGNTLAAASLLTFSGNAVSRQGIISTRSDVDVFRFEVGNPGIYSFTATPFSVNTSTLSGANLDIRLVLQNSAGTQIGSANDTTVLGSALNNVALNAGTYYITVDGAGVANYRDIGSAGTTDYGSLGTYTLNGSFTSNFAGTPVISPGQGTYQGPQTVSLSSSTSGASIYYTLTGNTPSIGTSFTVLYTGPFTVNQTTTVKAMAVKTGFQNSSVATAVLTISSPPPAVVSTPVISPATGTFTTPQSVTISTATQGATILYTTNGNVPSTSVNSFTFQYSGAFTLSSTTTVRAIAIKTGLTNSAVAVSTLSFGTSAPMAATPVIQPGSGTYSGPQTITLSTATAGATIYYTTTGNTPVIGAGFTQTYTGPFTLSNSATIRAMAVRSGFSNSGVAVANLTINPLIPVVATPVITPGTGSYAGPQTVTITCSTPGSTIYYTTSGNLPQIGTSFTRVYTGSFQVTTSTTVRAMGTASGFTNSAIAAAFLTLSGGIAPSTGGPEAAPASAPEAPGFSLYPNPARELAEIVWEEPVTGMPVTVRDSQGRERLSWISRGEGTEKFSVAGWPAGLYILHAGDASGRIRPRTFLVE